MMCVECPHALFAVRTSSSQFGTSVRVTRVPAPMTLGMTGDAWTAPYFDMDVQDYPHPVVSHGATCGA